MNHPKLDHRSPEDLRRQVAQLAQAYTPEWRFEQAENDPGAALAELFCTMHSQTVDRMNSLSEKLYMEFLNQIGFREPGPVSAQGAVRFTPYSTAEDPIPVPSGTQVFASDEVGDNIVYETVRSIEATPAALEDIYYIDGAEDCVEQLPNTWPQRFFRKGSGEALQRHRLELGQNDVLALDRPSSIVLELQPEVRYHAEEAVDALVGEHMRWTYCHQGKDLPFDRVRHESGRIILEKQNNLSIDPNEDGQYCIACEGSPKGVLRLQQANISSSPIEDDDVQSMFFNDLPILPDEGGYCFGQQPTPYGLFYLRSDTAFSKRGAQVRLRMNIFPVVREPDRQSGRMIQYTKDIIDMKSEVEEKPDDVFVSGVTWEYYNAVGWRRLAVSGDRNPFSCQREGQLETVFTVPEDMTPTEVNAEQGYYIRARVTDVMNQFSVFQRVILPFIRGAQVRWNYEAAPRVRWISAWNHGVHTQIEQADQYDDLSLLALEPMEIGPKAMYFRFDRSPHAMPMSLRISVQGNTPIQDQLQWEQWNGERFEAVRSIDMTENLYHSGEVFLFLPDRLPQAAFFGKTGCWLRLCKSAVGTNSPSPVVTGFQLNTVTAVQCQHRPEQTFDTAVYEAGKVIYLLNTPVQACEVWVDEAASFSHGEAQQMAQENPENVQLEWEDHQLRRVWVRWNIVPELSLCSSDARACELDPYTGAIRFGNGRQGRVPPAGDHNIRVRYSSGGGTRGNLPVGRVTSLLGGLPRISEVVNVTPMSGGTSRLNRQQIESSGNRMLRNRGRAGSRRDYEDIVRQGFPQVRHVRCFSGRDDTGADAPGHVCVVLVGSGEADSGIDALCRQVYEYLSRRSSCCLAQEGRLHVCPATVLTVNVQVMVLLDQPELAADTQQEISRRLSSLIENTWASRPIGSQIRIDEVWNVVRETANVRLIDRILVEGAYDQMGHAVLVPLERDTDFPYGVARNGLHQIRVR